MTELMTRPQTREAWLQLAVLKLRPLFDEIDVELPAVHVSVGWPSKGGTASKSKVIGQCWVKSVSSDNVSQVFISPLLGGDRFDVIKMLGVLLHELVHASDNCESGHRGEFAKRARALGLEGQMTATVVGEALDATLSVIVDELGDYPHPAMRFEEMEKQRAPQTTRMLKLECPADGYIVRTTQKWLDVGTPSCPCGEQMELA